MPRRMLIDARHPGETRVAIQDNQELHDFDLETASRTQIKSNIYLAKVVRIEPSLQAAFIEYGGDRHGFLPFSEIHPDYFQIPVADREKLATEQAQIIERARDLDEDGSDGQIQDSAETETTEVVDEDPVSTDEMATDNDESNQKSSQGDSSDSRKVRNTDDAEGRASAEIHAVILKRGYRIQEVIKKRQILLVQVAKEERGNKGAALTTYLSIAGRYCVLMPNTPRGGGISRKITDATKRKNLKKVAADLQIPNGMGLIVRTAGQDRTGTEIRRDFRGLLKQWEVIRSTTLKEVAPSLIFEEGTLIKRAIRDLYSRSIDEVLVEGKEGYRLAKSSMQYLIPSHAKKVQLHKDKLSLFHKYGVERELDAMYSPIVQLNSGGYVVISPTEALVAIDVNSGRSNRERSIEDTAYKTNLEAAKEIARQLRLRDLAGLIVIDFIDMMDRQNERGIERKFKEMLKEDRARIQVGRISQFGLLSLSRQRMRRSVQEALSTRCDFCGGTGYMHSVEASALHVLRAIEGRALNHNSGTLTVQVPPAVGFFVLNHHRRELSELETRFELSIGLEPDESISAPNYKFLVADPADRIETAQESTVTTTEDMRGTLSDISGDSGRKRRRSRRKRRETENRTEEQVAPENAAGSAVSASAGDDTSEPRRKRRRRRTGRRRKENEKRTTEGSESKVKENVPEMNLGSGRDSAEGRLNHQIADAVSPA